jgi:hypothetical protein
MNEVNKITGYTHNGNAALADPFDIGHLLGAGDLLGERLDGLSHITVGDRSEPLACRTRKNKRSV